MVSKQLGLAPINLDKMVDYLYEYISMLSYNSILISVSKADILKPKSTYKPPWFKINSKLGQTVARNKA